MCDVSCDGQVVALLRTKKPGFDSPEGNSIWVFSDDRLLYLGRQKRSGQGSISTFSG